ncbi:hypothetical protein Ddye_002306 [Dipteronia dyeriana]|uniref:Uncharacterized protein n=1 Tax=Dipteronia dyeriana TaxID=168575 RepID=A0AAE0CU99_9ROSI|nr:hypothetical protein Ddye_002306 [Dipteronia dyeriana]
MATLQNQIAYRLQDHVLDLPIPGHTGDTIFITTEREDEIPTIIQIPKQLPREKLKEVMPLEWITNYEKAFQNTTPVIASETKYVKQKDGSIKTVYETITESKAFSGTPPVFQALMIIPVTSEDDIPIHNFQADGSPVYTDFFILKIRNRIISSDSSQFYWNSDIAISSHQSYSDAVADLTRVFMASRIDPQPSTQTFDSSDEASTEQENTDRDAIFVLQDSDSSISGFFESSDTDVILESYQATQIVPHVGPQVPIQILLEKFSKHVDVIAYIDTDSHNTMMNLKILPSKDWKPYVRYFKAADGQIFTTNLISRNKIGIKIFPSCTI